MDLLDEPLHTTRPARVEQPVFLGVVWGGVWISFIFVCIRLFSRWKFSKRLFVDDGLVIFAWLLALGTAIDWQVLGNYMYQSIAFTSGTLFPAPPNFIEHMREYLHGNAVVLFFFYTSLWAIKFSFLVFFRRLDKHTGGRNWLWWGIMGFNVATYCACVGDIQWWCLTPPLLEIVKNCSSSAARDYEVVTLKFNTAMDVVTDYLIVAIPMVMLWNVQMTLQKKMLLMGIFSLVIITTVISIVRVAVVTDLLAAQPDESWAFMWSSIEQTCAIVVACLASFRTLFTYQTPRYEPPKQRSFIDALRRRRRPDDSDMTTNLTDLSKTTYVTQGTDDTSDTLNESNADMMADIEMAVKQMQVTSTEHDVPSKRDQLENRASFNPV